ncbi:MAG: phage holin family protein [Bacteroidetes bacterium]|nr:phage holin family protein [Bacteroidota bacterium]
MAGLGLRFKYWLAANLASLGLAFGWHWLDHHVHLYVWSPSLTYYLVFVIVVADFCTGATFAWRQGRFETRKALRSIWKLVSYTFLLSVAHNLGQKERVFGWLPEAVLFPMVVILLLSLLKNLSLLGWIDPRLAHLMYKKIDTYKNPPSHE